MHCTVYIYVAFLFNNVENKIKKYVKNAYIQNK